MERNSNDLARDEINVIWKKQIDSNNRPQLKNFSFFFKT